ncbi:hypothetical protein K7432_016311 [Basidiobolus ranarum]|uniref:Uncharacterized protein n=1 Tax=Basidiobolus ranarum TaxID=34480 RepID=A0ABR2WEX9_9FUNG
MFRHLLLFCILYVNVVLTLGAWNEIRMKEASDLFQEPRMESPSSIRIESGTIVKALCQTLDTKSLARASNDSTPLGRSVWTQVIFKEYTGYVPYERMDRTESWLPGAPWCSCRKGQGLLCIDDNQKLQHQEAEQFLNSHNILTSCTNNPDVACPSFTGIRNETIEGLVNFIAISNCTGVQVTGGTEVSDAESYYSHKLGFRIDFASSSCIDNYIKLNFHYVGNRKYGSPDKLYVACSGNTLARKQDHWEMSGYINGGSRVVLPNETTCYVPNRTPTSSIPNVTPTSSIPNGTSTSSITYLIPLLILFVNSYFHEYM